MNPAQAVRTYDAHANRNVSSLSKPTETLVTENSGASVFHRHFTGFKFSAVTH